MSRVSSAEQSADVRWRLLYVGVLITTLATLLLELSLTRLFSVVFYYHLAFLAISIALFGLGAGGVFSYAIASWRGGLFGKLGALAIGGSLGTIGALVFLLTRSGGMGNRTLALVYLTSAIPFTCAGAVLSAAVAETIERVDRVYFFDLIGAAGGCLLLIPMLSVLGGPNTIIAAAVLYTVSAAIWFTLAGAPSRRIMTVLLALAMVALVAVNSKTHWIDVRYAKGRELVGETFVKWNHLSRVAVAPDGNGHTTIFIDADASTGIPYYDFDHLTDEQRRGLLQSGEGLPYVLRPAAKTLIIGPGGGYDVARALASGSKNVTGVEINPIIANTITRERFPNLNNRLYFRPEVHIEVADGRSFVRRSDQKFTVLQATLVDTWAATAGGAFALSESSLYTVEAFRDYLEHLTDSGVLAFTRWGFKPPRESLRLVTLAAEALGQMGEPDAWKHVIVARANVQLINEWGATDTVLISRKPFSADDVATAVAAMERAGLEKVYVPGETGGSAFADYLRSPDREAFLRNYPFDVSPVTDNKPFFFYTVQPRDVWDFFRNGAKASADYKINKAVPLLFGLVIVSVLATAVMLALPPLVLGSRLPRESGVRGFLFYFVFIGVGYILIQVALIQKFVLFLGHPVYAVTVIIFSMLISSGLGSYYSRRAPVMLSLGMVPLLVMLLALIVTPVTTAAVGWSLPSRVAMSIAMIAPAGFMMGMPFPSGLGWLEKAHKASLRWAWSINAAASVMGSALAVFFALYLGLRTTLLIGGLMYIGALTTFRFAARPRQSN